MRLSLGSIGGYLVNKFVKQTKINSGFTHERGFDQVALIEAEPNEEAGGARVLGEADPAVGGEVARFNLPDCALDQVAEFLALVLGDGGTEVLNLDQPFADEDDLRDFGGCQRFNTRPDTRDDSLFDWLP